MRHTLTLSALYIDLILLPTVDIVSKQVLGPYIPSTTVGMIF